MAAPLHSEQLTRIGNEEFVRLLGLSQGRVFSFVITLLPDWTEAEEVVARTSVVLWKKLDEFRWQEAGSREQGEEQLAQCSGLSASCSTLPAAFVRWACGIAYRQTLAYLRERRRSHLTLSLDVLDQIVQDRLNQDQLLEDRRRALRGCLEKLPDSDRQIIDAYYCNTRKTAADVGSELGRPTNTILKALIRIRRVLHRCIDRSVDRGEGWPFLAGEQGGEPS